MVTGMAMIELIRAEKADPPSGIATLGLDRTHKWLTRVDPGEVDLEWAVDDAYLNLEGAVICSWTAALADQALFFATNTLCAEGEGTRMTDLRLQCLHNITAGTVRIEARVIDRVGDRMYGTCRFILDDGRVAADVSAVVDVIR